MRFDGSLTSVRGMIGGALVILAIYGALIYSIWRMLKD